LLHSPLLAPGFRGDHSLLDEPTEAAAIETWLGLSHATPSLRDIEVHYADYPQLFVTFELAPPCHEYQYHHVTKSILPLVRNRSLRHRYHGMRALTAGEAHKRLEEMFSQGEATPAREQQTGMGIGKGAVLVRGCGFAIEHHELGAAYGWWWRAKAAAAAAVARLEVGKPVAPSRVGTRLCRLQLTLFATGSANAMGARVTHVAVHVRRGDFLLPKHKKRLTPDRYFVSAMCSCLWTLSTSRRSPSQVHFHIFSESSIAATRSRTWPGGETGLPAVGKGVYVDESGLAADLGKDLRAAGTACNPKHQSWKLHYWIDTSPVEALRHMSAADVLIADNSGFSLLAAQLSMAGIVIAPSKIVGHSTFNLISTRVVKLEVHGDHYHHYLDPDAQQMFRALWLAREDCRSACRYAPLNGSRKQ